MSIQNCNNPSCKFWHLPVCVNYKSEKRFSLWRQMPFPTCWGIRETQQEVEERWCERISCYSEGVYTIRLRTSRFLSEKIYSTRTGSVGIKTRRQILQRHLAPNQNSAKKGCEVLSKSVRFMSVLARQNSRIDHMRRPCTKNDALAKQRGIWRKIFTSSRIRTKLRFMFLVKSKVCRRLLLQRDQKKKQS